MMSNIVTWDDLSSEEHELLWAAMPSIYPETDEETAQYDLLVTKGLVYEEYGEYYLTSQGRELIPNIDKIRLAAAEDEIKRLRSLITTGVEHIKSVCNENLIGCGGIDLFDLPKGKQGYYRISMNADELNQMASQVPQE